MLIILATSRKLKNLVYCYHSLAQNATFHIAKHGSEETNTRETVANIKHGLGKHPTDRNNASCDKNLYTRTRSQKAYNKLKPDNTPSVILKQGLKIEPRKGNLI